LRQRLGGKQAEPPVKPIVKEIALLTSEVAAQKFLESKKRKVELELSDFLPLGSSQAELEDVVEAFVRVHRDGKLLPSGQNVAQLNLLPVSPEAVARIKALTGLDVSGTIHSIDTRQIDHAFNRHGPLNNTNPNRTLGETDATQEPINADTFAAYLDVVENFDRISGIRKKGSGTTITFEKDVDGVVVIVEQLQTKTKGGKTPTLAFFDMWIKKAKP